MGALQGCCIAACSFERNRAIRFGAKDRIPEQPSKHCIAMALRGRLRLEARGISRPDRKQASKKASSDDIMVPLGLGTRMTRKTLPLDDELLAKAKTFTGLKDDSSLVREALKALIERESARRLARLGGSAAAGLGTPIAGIGGLE
jgi:Arc/MetJ family transcription regulator